MPTVEAKVEDVEDSEEDLPDLEPSRQNVGAKQEAASKVEAAAKGASGKAQSRSEKKSRKAVQRLGMKPFPGVVSVKVKKGKGVC